MKPEEMIIHAYNPELSSHIPTFKTKNPVSVLFSPTVARKTAQDFISFMGLEIIKDDKKNLVPTDEDIPF